MSITTHSTFNPIGVIIFNGLIGEGFLNPRQLIFAKACASLPHPKDFQLTICILGQKRMISKSEGENNEPKTVITIKGIYAIYAYSKQSQNTQY